MYDRLYYIHADIGIEQVHEIYYQFYEMDVPVVIPSLSLQPEINGRPFPGCPLCPDVAAMTMDDALYNGKADSCNDLN